MTKIKVLPRLAGGVYRENATASVRKRNLVLCEEAGGLWALAE